MLRLVALQGKKPLRIEIPKDESPRLGRVGLIAIVGFAIGIVWPRLAGMRLVPAAPTEKTETSSADLTGAPADAGAQPVSSASPAELEPPLAVAPAASASAAGPDRQPFSVGPGEVSSCRDRAGKRRETCDPIDFDAVARGRIATLSACDVVDRVEGVLSLGFDLDFEKDRVTGLQSGKRTSLPPADVDALLGCLRRTLGEVSLSGLKHELDRYTVFYRVDFKGASAASEPTAGQGVDVTPANGKATVAWDVALVRASPLRDAKVVARVLQGTRVSVTGRNGDWYRIKYDARGNEGWTFRTAIGM